MTIAHLFTFFEVLMLRVEALCESGHHAPVMVRDDLDPCMGS